MLDVVKSDVQTYATNLEIRVQAERTDSLSATRRSSVSVTSVSFFFGVVLAFLLPFLDGVIIY